MPQGLLFSSLNYLNYFLPWMILECPFEYLLYIEGTSKGNGKIAKILKLEKLLGLQR